MTTARRWGLLAAVFVAAALVYANTTQNGFVLDDRRLIETNPLIRGIEGVPILFQADYWAPRLQSGLYRPLVMSSYALNYEFSGLDPSGYHVVNIVLHALTSVLVAAFFLRVCAHPAPAIAAGLLFATHAVHTEAVANVVGRAELLATLLFMSALLASLRVRSSPAQARWLQPLALVAYFLALLTKESAVTLVGVLAVVDVVKDPGPRLPLVERVTATLRRHWKEYLAYVAVTVLYLGARRFALPGSALPPLLLVDNPLVLLDGPVRIVAALQVALEYLWLAVWPLHLSYDYSFQQIDLVTSLAEPRAWGVLGIWALLAAGTVWAYRRAPGVFLAVGFYVATFSVVANIVVPIGTILGERLLYLPSVGFCLGIALLGWRFFAWLPLPERVGPRAFAVVAALVIGLHAVRAVERNQYWESQERLYLHDVHVVPNSTKALGNAGAILVGRGRHEEALELLERAIEIYPQNEKALKMAGFAYTALGRDDEAMERYDDAIRYGEKEATVFNNLGFLLVDRAIDVPRGLRLLQQAVERAPRNAEYHDSLGWGYYKAGRLELARRHLQQSLALSPRGPSAPERRAHLAEIERALAASR